MCVCNIENDLICFFFLFCLAVEDDCFLSWHLTWICEIVCLQGALFVENQKATYEVLQNSNYFVEYYFSYFCTQWPKYLGFLALPVITTHIQPPWWIWVMINKQGSFHSNHCGLSILSCDIAMHLDILCHSGSLLIKWGFQAKYDRIT